MPHIVQQVALGPVDYPLPISQQSTLVTSENIDDLEGLEIVEVAYGGLAVGRGMIWLRIRFWVSVLGVEIRNSLDFLWVFFFAFRYYRYNRRYWLLLKFVDVSMGVVNLKDKVVDLLLEELDNCVTLSDYGITLIDLILRIMVSSRSAIISSFSVTKA
jgi:sensor histidine kinase YesM